MPRFREAKEGDKIPISDYNLKTKYLEAIVNMKVHGATFKIDKGGASLTIDHPVQSEIRWAKLLEDLAVADEEGLDTPSTATAVLLVGSGTGEEPLVETETNNPVTITNRWPDYTAEQGDVILICRTHLGTKMEWTPLPVGSTTETDVPDDDNFPPGTGSCPCNTCYEGVTIPDATKCCRSHLRWTLINPWLAATTSSLILEYMGNDEWISEIFEGPNCGSEETPSRNEYRWHLTISITGQSYLTLVLVTDNGCDVVCAVYWKDSFECQCNNTFTILHPFGKWAGIPRNKLSCNACVSPVVDDGEYLPVDLGVSLGNCGFAGCASDVEVQDGLEFANQLVISLSGFDGLWCQGFGDSEAGFSFTKTGLTCTAGDRKTAFADGEINGNWLVNRSGQPPGGAGCTLGRGSIRVNALADAVCATWSAGLTVGHYRTGACVEDIDLIGTACVTLLKLGCQYWFEVQFPYPTNSPPLATGGLFFYSDVATFTESGTTSADIQAWINSVHSLTQVTTCPVCTSTSGAAGECDCTDTIYADATCGTVTLTTASTFLSVPPVDPPSPTDSGVCDETCAETPAPDDPDQGACCFAGLCYDFWDAALCASFGGEWHADIDDCIEQCEGQVGACCVNGICVYTTDHICDLMGGSISIGVECTPDPCVEGACCNSLTGECSIESEENCQAPNYWWGAATDCDPDPCAGVGSCCHNDDGPSDCHLGNDCYCELMTEAECNAIGGSSTATYGGDGTFCGSGDATCDCIDSVCEHA